MNSTLIAPTRNTVYRPTHAGGGRLFGLAAKMLAICTLLVGLSPFASWASAPVNINLASAEVLAESLQGVGIAKAHRIVEYREAHGPFEHIDELAAVQGIGSTTVEKNRSVIRLQ